MITNRFPGLRKISYLPCEKAFIDHQGLYNAPGKVRLPVDSIEIPIVGQGRMEIDSNNRTGETVYTTKVIFTMPDCECSEEVIREITGNACSFVVTDNLNRRRLVGLREKPHPVAAVNYLNEEIPSGKALYTVEITHTDVLPPPVLEQGRKR